ncbi:MAG TPA: TIM barrel protein [Bryobacteraceae bacterium]|nr:TIM barrel protein [Bryobacteraceae bacterium]
MASPKITSSVMLWTLKGTFEERVQIAARAGIQSVELVAEHAQWSATEAAAKLKFVRSFNMGMDTIIATPEWGKRPVSMVDPQQRENFLADVRKAIEWAQRLEVPQIILMSGNAIPGRTRAEQYASLVEGAKRAAELAAQAKLTLIMEPLNSKVNHKGYFLDTCVEGLKLVNEVGSPALKLLFDLYHEQVQAGDVSRTLADAAPHVAVFHVADNPGRNDPGTGEMNYPHLYKSIAKTGFSGYICMEYLPLADPVVSLKKAVDEMRANVSG